MKSKATKQKKRTPCLPRPPTVTPTIVYRLYRVYRVSPARASRQRAPRGSVERLAMAAEIAALEETGRAAAAHIDALERAAKADEAKLALSLIHI